MTAQRLASFLLICAIVLGFTLGVHHAAQAQTGGEAFAGFRTQNDQPIKIEADSLEVKDTEKLALFKGRVEVRQGETVMKSATLHVFYEGDVQPGGGTQGIRRIEARGKVLVTSGNNTATGDRADFDMRQQVVVLSGNVVLSQCENIVVGESLTVNLESGEAQLSAPRRTNGQRVTAIFTPGEGEAQENSPCE
ncbi:MAG: lipopolysaccharide transport periplasmic protein LptA [Pseudomonadota bacterium]